MFQLKNSKDTNSGQADPVFPGENWFFYWKSSPSLWQSKLEQTSGNHPIFVPIFWGFHCEYEDTVDFGSIKPEANLKKLFEIANSIGRSLVFLAPIMPMPFLPNGGLPSYVARMQAIDENGMVICSIDNENRLNKMYSFYEPKVFMAYKKFMRQLGLFFHENKIASHIYGCDCFRVENDRLVSYLDDTSQSYTVGFERFIKNQSPPVVIDSIEKEMQLKREYKKLIDQLYVSSAQENLERNWSGKLSFTFLGGSTDNIFSRSSELWEFPGNYFKSFINIISKDKIPSTILLPTASKVGLLSKAIEEFVSPAFIYQAMKDNFLEESSDFSPLFFVDLIKFNTQDYFDEYNFESSGFKNFLDSNFDHAYVIKDQFEFNEQNMSEQKIHFFNGPLDEPDDLKIIFKLLLNSGKIMIDTCQFSTQVKKKLDSFIIENNISRESVNYLIQVDLIELGDGKIICFDSSKLKQQAVVKKTGFWERIFNFLQLNHLNIEHDDDVCLLWQTRAASPMELNYEEIRRISLFNPTSYKKKVKIVSSKNFALVKINNQENVQIDTSPIGTVILMLPGARVNFDFGVIE